MSGIQADPPYQKKANEHRENYVETAKYVSPYQWTCETWRGQKNFPNRIGIKAASQ